VLWGVAGFEDLEIGEKEGVSGNEMIEEPAIWREAHIQAFLNIVNKEHTLSV